MESTHLLKSLLQLQLATDASAVQHLPYVLNSLSHDLFSSSPHLPKWTARINSLLHSKDSSGRWAGLCLAHKTSVLSQSTMIDSAHNWLPLALSMLSKNEPTPTLKGSVRLLRVILSSATNVTEFQRQVAIPNVPKSTTAMIGLADKHNDVELKILILTTLTHLIPIYPTLHRASHAALSALSLRFLNGSASSPTSNALIEAASRLYAVLHFTGGKVGGANVWRQSLDETLAFGYNAFFALRSTFPKEAHNPHQNEASTNDDLTSVPLNIDRLRCSIVVICDLLRSTTHRPIQMPLGSIVRFATTLLKCTLEDKQEATSDPIKHTLEVSAIPVIWRLSCDLIACMAKASGQHLSPHLTQLVSYLTYHLEQKLPSSERLSFLTTLQAVLGNCNLLDSPLIPTRLTKAVLPSLSIILTTPARDKSTDEATATLGKGKKGKKRARGYEGDEVFKMTRDIICPTNDDGQVMLAALDVMELLLWNPNLTLAMQSISSRALISILLVLPQMVPATLSPDLSLHGKVLRKVQTICLAIGSGTTSVMSKSLGIVVGVSMNNGNSALGREIDILLHPRVPPLVRSLPHVESLSLYRAEESQEEIDARQLLELEASYPPPVESVENFAMDMQPVNLSSSAKENTPAAPVSNPPQSSKTMHSLPISVLSSASNHVQQKVSMPQSKPQYADSLPSHIVDVPMMATGSSALHNQVIITYVEDEDEEMPTLDLDSDSEEE